MQYKLGVNAPVGGITLHLTWHCRRTPPQPLRSRYVWRQLCCQRHVTATCSANVSVARGHRAAVLQLPTFISFSPTLTLTTASSFLPHGKSVFRPNVPQTPFRFRRRLTLTFFRKVARSVQGYRRPDEWNSDATRR